VINRGKLRLLSVRVFGERSMSGLSLFRQTRRELPFPFLAGAIKET